MLCRVPLIERSHADPVDYDGRRLAGKEAVIESRTFESVAAEPGAVLYQDVVGLICEKLQSFISAFLCCGII